MDERFFRRPIEPFTYERETNILKVLDQRLLQNEIVFLTVDSIEDAKNYIKDMVIRGAPSIAAFGCFALIQELNKLQLKDKNVIKKGGLSVWIEENSKLLIEARPTAVNLKNTLTHMSSHEDYLEDLYNGQPTSADIVRTLTNYCIDGLRRYVGANKKIGYCGADVLLPTVTSKITILTHCNTGSLATPGYGTALGVIRAVHERNSLIRAYCTETRPYNQGSRITAWELMEEKIPVTLIADSMCAFLMQEKKIDAVLVGADRIAKNGDTANKIGTLQLAILAKHYQIPFYVAAPNQTFDASIEDGSTMTIEYRRPEELRKIGNINIAPEGVDVWNPCFDITPGSLITGFITQSGYFKSGSNFGHLSKENIYYMF